MNHGGPYTVMLRATGGGTSVTASGTFSVDKKPTVSIAAPIGIVTSPFDVTGTATFKPTLNTTKGTISAYINGGYIGNKTCTTETCRYSYQEITGNLISRSPGENYTVKMIASGGGTSNFDQKQFSVETDPIKPALGPSCEK
jgi:hypothetical protein